MNLHRSWILAAAAVMIVGGSLAGATAYAYSGTDDAEDEVAAADQPATDDESANAATGDQDGSEAYRSFRHGRGHGRGRGRGRHGRHHRGHGRTHHGVI